MITIDNIIAASGVHKSKVHNIYLFGSRVYKTYFDDSDWDIIVVANNSVEAIEIKSGDFNIHIYTPDKFQQDLDWHTPKNIECLFAPKCAKLQQKIRFDFNLNPIKLRHATLHTSNQSWKKGKSKLSAANYHSGIKSLFHSIRIPIFSTQLLEFGQIDFLSANYIWNKLWDTDSDWCHYSDLPSPISYMKSDFSQLEKKFDKLRRSVTDKFIDTVNQKI